MADIDKKIDVLEEKLSLQLKKSKRTLKTNIIAYAVIVAFVITYTAYITKSFKELATPSTVAELLVMQTELALPELNEYLKENSELIAEQAAVNTVESIRAMVPSLGLLVKMQFDVLVDSINAEFSTKYMPIIDEYLKENRKEIIYNIKTMSDEKAAKLLAEGLFEQIDFDLLNINNEFTGSVLKFKKEINKLAYTPNNKLTKRELAHKRAIAYWMFLLKYAEIGEIPFFNQQK